MRAAITTVLLLIWAHAAFSQGTVIFSNVGTTNFPTPADRLVRFPDGSLVVGTQYVVQLYYGTDPSSLNQHSASPSRFRVPTTASPGTWSGGTRTLTSFTSGSTVTMQVIAWDGAYPSADAARKANGVYGASTVYTYFVPPSGSPATNYLMDNFRGFIIGGCRGGVRIIEPTNGTALEGPATVTLRSELAVAGNATNVIYRSGSNIVGSATLAPFAVTVTNLSVNDYLFQAIAQLDTGEMCTSDQMLVRVMDAPNATVAPTNYTALLGLGVNFTATPRGSEPNHYTWYLGGNSLTNTGPMLSIGNVNAQADGVYTCVVSNAVGVSTSAPAVLKVRSVVVRINGEPVHSLFRTSNLPVTVEMQTAYERGTIFYTLDGSTPNFESQQYHGSFVVNRTVRLRAIAYRADFLDSGESEPVDILIPPLRSLSASTDGGGSIEITPPASTHREGALVQLIAQPEAGWSFLEWRGDVFGTNPVATLEMTGDRCVHAIFATTLTTTVAGNGQIVLDPPGGLYPWGTGVRLRPIPAPGNYFVLWGNHASGSDDPLVWSVRDANQVISSAFAPHGTNHVTLTVLVDGIGGVEKLPNTNRYTRGQFVTLRARPRVFQDFIEWDGDASGTERDIVVVLDSSKLIMARFTKTPDLRLGQPCRANFLSVHGFYATLFGEWGAQYAIDYADVLGNWQPLITLTNTFGNTRFIDLEATNRTQRFYRATLVEP
jgi:hypothetical protein